MGQVGVDVDQPDHLIFDPAGISSSTVKTRTRPSSATAAKTIPWESSPRILVGLRLASKATFFPTSSSGL